MPATVQTPHYAVPFRIVGDRVAVVEQDSTEEIRDCVLALLSTRLGSRVEEPDYGIPDELFELLTPEADADTVLAVIEEWEPRAAVTAEVAIDELVKQIQIRLKRSE